MALEPSALAPVEIWLDRQKHLWEGRRDQLQMLAEQIGAGDNPFPGKSKP